jgi:TonB-dependent starch-binding outer membrane protein SusC
MRNFKQILLSVLMLLPFAMFAQQTVKGKVLEKSTGQPLPGVNILVKGTTNGTTTDFDGMFSLSVKDKNAVLVFSFLGFKTQEVSASSSFMTISLEDDAQALNEVVIIGYGQTTKKDATGALDKVDSKNFNNGAIVSSDQLIAGKMAGVQVIPADGTPGAGATIKIRGGVSSLNASNSPLVVIDGVPVDQQGPALNSINPNDIESFTVLKDASATAIYGSRASGGVILITTKSGKTGGDLKINFSSYMSVANRSDSVDVLSAAQFTDLVNTYGSASDIAKLGTANTDWQDQIFDTALGTDNNLTLSGGFKHSSYRVSLGYLNQNGILKTSNIERTSLSTKFVQYLFNDDLKIDINLKGASVGDTFANGGAIGSAIAFDPTKPVYSGNSDYGGYWEWLDGAIPLNLAPRNPLGLLEQTNSTAKTRRTIGNIQFDYKIPDIDGLKANLNVGYDYSDVKGQFSIPATAASNFTEQGLSGTNFQLRRSLLVDFYLNYVKEFEKLQSKIDITIGHSFQDFHREFSNYSINGVGIETSPRPFTTENSLVSYFARANYSFKGKYLATYTFRRDGSSRFGPKNRWGNFNSVALAWNISEEGNLKDSDVLSNLKLRLGYGETGQQELSQGDFPYLPIYTPGDARVQYQFGNTFFTTLRPEGYDENIKWEETKTYNVGLDYGFFNDRITGSIDIFYTRTNDVLNAVTPAAGSNLDNLIVTNVGNLESNGAELSVNAKIVDTDDFSWDLNVNTTFLNNVITKLTASNDPSFIGNQVGGISGGVGNTIQINTVGYGQNAFFVYKQVYDTAGKPIEGVYEDLNGDGVVNINDRYQYKDPNADMLLGISSYLRYKKFDLSFTLRASFGNYAYNNVASTTGNLFSLSSLNALTNVHSSVLDTKFQNQRLFSDYYVQEASFLKLDNITLGYNFDKIFNQKVNLRLYTTVQNLFTITNYTGVDPEINGGIDNNFNPRPRTVLFGFNFNF